VDRHGGIVQRFSGLEQLPDASREVALEEADRFAIALACMISCLSMILAWPIASNLPDSVEIKVTGSLSRYSQPAPT
jgi:hypothetical protein